MEEGRRRLLMLLAGASAVAEGAPANAQWVDAARVMGVSFDARDVEAAAAGALRTRPAVDALRAEAIENSVAPPLVFQPIVPGMKIDRVRRPMRWGNVRRLERPADLEDLAFATVRELGELLRTRRVRSVEMTEMYLARMDRLNPVLRCVVTVTRERALRQAREADREIAAGRYKGPLHGIPWGVKDLLAVKGYPTTWGAAPFRDRVVDMDATVVARLDAAGAVLVAKLSTGELALDDVWFGGQTMNPWDVKMGSQGSSAGPGSATAAGLVGFSIGTETAGSIGEPSGICGVTGLRPTFGRVSRHGAMALSWSLDKIGPMCRCVEDCAVVLQAIAGPDDWDLSVQDVPFSYDGRMDVRGMRVGYVKAAFDDTRQSAQVNANDAAALSVLRGLGVELVEVSLPEHAGMDLGMIINPEANAALRDLVRGPARDGLVRQDRIGGQMGYRTFTATDYVDANRVRALLMREMAEMMAQVDVYLTPFDYADYTPNPVSTLNLAVTNLTGQPCILTPHGFDEKGHPTALVFNGSVFGEARMMAVAKAYQDATDWHRRHPKL